MRILLALAAIFLGAWSTARGEDASFVGVLPKDREATPIAEGERNPFAKKEEKKVAAPMKEDAESEESRIRRALESMSVVGRTRGDDGRWKILLGNLILEQGRDVPQVIDGQTQRLRVSGIFDGVVEIEWVEKEGGGDPRRIYIPVDLSARVRTSMETPSNGPSKRKPRR